MLYKTKESIYHIIVNRNPKCHSMISGEGIEYYWGCAKNYNRRLSLDKNKGNKTPQKVSYSSYQETNLPQIRFVFFLDMHENISLHTN